MLIYRPLDDQPHGPILDDQVTMLYEALVDHPERWLQVDSDIPELLDRLRGVHGEEAGYFEEIWETPPRRFCYHASPGDLESVKKQILACITAAGGSSGLFRQAEALLTSPGDPVNERAPEVAVGSVVQIINRENRWFPALLVVAEVTRHGLLRAYAVMPTNGPEPNGQAHVFLEPSDVAVVGWSRVRETDEHRERLAPFQMPCFDLLNEYMILLAHRVAHQPVSAPSDREVELYRLLGGKDA